MWIPQTIRDILTTKGDIVVHNGTRVVRLAVGSNDQVLTADSAVTAGVKWATASGAATTGTDWFDYLSVRLARETGHADDDFFNDASKAGTEQTVSGNATWTELDDLLSVKWDSQTGGDAAAYLNALTPSSAPVTIETAVKFNTPPDNFHAVAVCFTDGTATTSNHGAAVLYRSAGNLIFQERAGTLTDMAADVGNTIDAFDIPNFGRAYLRIVWTAANTFEIAYSIDGITWDDHGAGSFTKTMTPTHFGVFVTSGGATTVGQAAFDYLRVNESDLSA